MVVGIVWCRVLEFARGTLHNGNCDTDKLCLEADRYNWKLELVVPFFALLGYLSNKLSIILVETFTCPPPPTL